MHTGMPMGLLRKAEISLSPTAAISPAETAPMPRKAPCAQAASDTPPSAIASSRTTINGAVNMPANPAKAPAKPK